LNEARDSVARQVETLAAWAASVSIIDVPGDVQRRAVMVLADDIAAVVASRDEPEVASARAALVAASRKRESTILDGSGARIDRWSAAVANAISCNWAELDEGYRLATCHSGLYAVPAAIAEAEAERRSLADLLTAIVVSYEITARFARAWRFPPASLHPHGVFSPLGAAAAVGKLRALDARRFLAAVTASTTLSLASPFNHAIKGILVRNVWAGAGAWLGMHAVDWASAGIGGTSASPFDVYSAAFSADFQEDVLVEGLGTSWAIARGYHKLYACCQYGHSAVEATLALRKRLEQEGDLDRTTRIVVEASHVGMMLDNPTPATTLAGKFSMQHIVATTLVNRDAGPGAFTAAMLGRADIVGLREKVSITPLLPERPTPQDRAARITVTLEDGRSYTELCLSARGGPDRPFTDEEVQDKIASLTAATYPRFASTVRQLHHTPERFAERRWDSFLRSMLSAAPSATARNKDVPALV
jgi:2-methylcitrate dehydratase PrpD